jgi:hypothetical protein
MNLGLILILLGLGAYFGLGRQSVTALIPAFFGVPFYLLGRWARDESKRKLAMHLAATLALLGFGGSFSGITATIRLMGGAELERPEAAVVKAVMALLCLAFLVLAVRSFILARRAMAAN